MKPPSPRLESIDGDKYRLTEDYVIKIGYWLRHLQLAIPENYVTDLASIPPILRGFGDRASLGTAAVTFHDWACDNRGKLVNLNGEPIELTWFQVQLYFLVMLELDGIPWQRSLAAFLRLEMRLIVGRVRRSRSFIERQRMRLRRYRSNGKSILIKGNNR